MWCSEDCLAQERGWVHINSTYHMAIISTKETVQLLIIVFPSSPLMDEETEAQKCQDLPRVTQEREVQSQDSRLDTGTVRPLCSTLGVAH